MDEKLTHAVEELVQQAKGIRIEVEASRAHANSATYFLQIAIEDFCKAVEKLETAIKTDD